MNRRDKYPPTTSCMKPDNVSLTPCPTLSIISIMQPDSPFLHRNGVAMELQRNAEGDVSSFKYPISHTMAPSTDTSRHNKLPFPATFHQVLPSNVTPDRNSGSSSGYVPFHPAPSHLYESVAQSGPSEATQYDTSPTFHSDIPNPVYCNLPFQQNIAPFVPLTRHNLLPNASLDSLDSSRQDTFSSPLSNLPFQSTPLRHSPVHTDTFHPVKFISMDESDNTHTSMRSLATPASTRLFLSTPIDSSMLSLSASQDCIHDSNRNTQKKCIKLLSASMNLNPEVTSWVIPPSVRAKRRSLASVGHSSLAGSVESMELDSVPRVSHSVPSDVPRRDKGFSRMMSSLFGFLKFPSRKRYNQSAAGTGKRKNRGRVVEQTISHTSRNVSHAVPFMSLPVPSSGIMPRFNTIRSHSPVLGVPIAPNGGVSERRESNATPYGAVVTQFERKMSSHSNQINSSPGNANQVADMRHLRPAQLPLSHETSDTFYENLPLKSPPRAKPPIPRPNSIYSNTQDSRDTSPPQASRTPNPGGPHHICDTRNRAGKSENLNGYSESVPFAGLRKSVTEHSNAKREKNVKYVGSTPSMNLMNEKATDLLSSGVSSRKDEGPNPLTGPIIRRATNARPSLTPKPAKFSSVETLC